MDMIDELFLKLRYLCAKIFIFACNDFDPSDICKFFLRNFTCLNRKVCRILDFILCRKRDPELKTMSKQVVRFGIDVKTFVMDYSVTSFHPLRSTGIYFRIITAAVEMFTFTADALPDPELLAQTLADFLSAVSDAPTEVNQSAFEDVSARLPRLGLVQLLEQRLDLTMLMLEQCDRVHVSLSRQRSAVKLRHPSGGP